MFCAVFSFLVIIVDRLMLSQPVTVYHHNCFDGRFKVKLVQLIPPSVFPSPILKDNLWGYWLWFLIGRMFVSCVEALEKTK